MDKEVFERGLTGARERASKKPGCRFFDETMLHPKGTALDAPKFIEFDWELLRRKLGEAHEEMGDEVYALLADVMGELLRWIVKGNQLDVIGRRAVALAWVTNPEIFNGSSLANLAKTVFAKRGTNTASSAVMFQQLSGEVSRRFGVRNRGQDHASNWTPGNGEPGN